MAASGSLLRPFSRRHRVTHRGYSLRLQRAMSDFGSDESFASAAGKLTEHYGVSVPVSAVQRVTQAHARRAQEILAQQEVSPIPNSASDLIAEMDGSMLPIVQCGQAQAEGTDRRKLRAYQWKEARLCAVVPRGSVEARYAVSFEGTAHAGMQLFRLAEQAGFRSDSGSKRIHGVGDGAPWIATEFEHQFGARSSYLLDLYHVSEYLAKAAEVACPEDPRLWLHNQQQLLRANEAQQVLGNLRAIGGGGSQPQAAQDAIRYLENRLGQLDYKGAIERGLPIGSGLIESGHRHVLQQRLKIPGAWWRLDNAKAMAHLRVLRKNNLWNSYWQTIRTAA